MSRLRLGLEDEDAGGVVDGGELDGERAFDAIALPIAGERYAPRASMENMSLLVGSLVRSYRNSGIILGSVFGCLYKKY